MPEQPDHLGEPGCARTRELIPDVAAGVASGEERARALAHVARCPRCRHELDNVTEVVDELVLLAPAVEPPAGFETSVLAQLAPQGRPVTRARRHTRVLLQAAALVVVAALASGATLWRTEDERQLAAHYQQALDEAHGRYLVAADLATGTSPEVGHVFAYEGSPSWIFLTAEGMPHAGRYEVLLGTRDGRNRNVGRLTVRDGATAWGTDIDVRVRDIALIRLVPVDRAAGTAVITARF